MNFRLFASRVCSVLALFAAASALLSCDRIAVGRADSLPDADRIAMQLAKSDRLYVAEYVVHKIVTADDANRVSGTIMGHDISIDLSIGERKIAIPMDANIKGYVDFSGLTADDIEVTSDPRRITITLPEPRAELTASKIDNAGIREYTGIFRSKFTDAEISDFERQGRSIILASIPRMGIISTAKSNAREALLPMLMQAGFEPENITIKFKN